MNVQARISGQISGQVPANQGSTQLPSMSQHRGNSLQNPGNSGMDPEFLAGRKTMCEKIFTYLQRRNHPLTGDWQRRLPELAKRLEDCIYKENTTKEEYLKMLVGPIEQRLQSIIRNLQHNSQHSSQNITSASTYSTMIPTPGMPHSAGGNSTISSNAMENAANTMGGAGMLPQTTNMGSLLPAASNLADVGHNASFNAYDGSITNGYQHSSANVSLGSSGTNIASSVASMGMSSRQYSQMIPTPGFNNQGTISMNSEYSNGGGFVSTDSSTMSAQIQPQQQKQYAGNQSSHMMHLGGQIGAGMRSNLQQKPSSYGFSNGLMNGGLSLPGSNNQQLVNGPAASEGYMNLASYGSTPKPLQQNFNQQHPQQRIPTSLSQQIMPMMADGYAMKPGDLAGTGNFYGPGSSVISSTSNPNANAVNMQSKLRTNQALLSHHSGVQAMPLQQPPLRSQMFDHPDKVNFQSSQLIPDQLVQSQQLMQHSQQQSNQPYAQFVQNQHQLQRQHQQSPQHQQFILKGTLRQSSVASGLAEQVMPEHPMLSHNDLVLPQSIEHVQLPELPGQYQQKTPYSNSKADQLNNHLVGSQDIHALVSQDSQQLVLSHQQSDGTHNELNRLPSSQWRPQLLQKTHMAADNSLLERHVQEELHQRISGRDEAQPLCIPLEGSVTHTSGANAASAAAPRYPKNTVAMGSEHTTQEGNYYNQLRLLLFLHHARRCPDPPGKCPDRSCTKAQQLVKHINNCNSKQCTYTYCSDSRKVLLHYRNCNLVDCPVCSRARKYLSAPNNQKAPTQKTSDQNAPWRIINGAGADKMEIDTVSIETSEFDQQSLPKRMRIMQPLSPSLGLPSEISSIPVHPINPTLAASKVPTLGASQVPAPGAPQEIPSQVVEQINMTLPAKTEVFDAKIDPVACFTQEKSVTFGYGIDEHVCTVRPSVELCTSNEVDCHVKQETMVAEGEIHENNIEVKQEMNDLTADSATGSKSGKPKIKGVSMTELFTPEQIREHIVSLRQWVGQSKAKAEKNQAMEHSMSENSCQLCAVEKLTFEPPPIYCSVCGARIKRNAMYYTIGSGETRHYICVPCYNECRGDTMEVEGSQYLKAKFEKKKNDEETEEWWVQCDKCEAWQHQICALFNGRRNDGGQAEYTCPNCYIEEIERGERKPLPQSAVLGAKDLPRTILSDHIEQRLSKRLKQERQERASHLSKCFDEVPGAEGLVVRVVSSVDKKLEVKPRFLEIFQEENYPTEFPYKSKLKDFLQAILLFQKIEGVEVCLFGMYVQEFGSECPFPNQRRVYLSYLDSVKYFRPDTRTLGGEALRTFVYHEILIGYLEYCKKRGFTSCYIWACPPLKGEDYILYCHPEIQKTPKSDKLREWYLSMLRKATKENIVVDLTNLYDHFFVTVGECKAKVTAARLPYFDGDYWPGAAEDMINQLLKEEDDRKQQKKGKTKKTLTKRALKAAGQADLSTNASKDALLMQKHYILPTSDLFVDLTLAGFLCHEAEQRVEERDRHPINSREKHMLYPVEIIDVPADTKDKDEILESEFFDTRQAFLSLCQGNHYQYDTLRRAKHSSMMVLYHLHNPTAPAFVTTCNMCHHDIEAGQGWRCEVCPDFDVCNACYQKEGGANHPHKLTNHPSNADRDAQNKEARQKRVLQLRKMLDLLVHASQCRIAYCQYPNCRKVKGLFRHGIQCKIRASGGCVLCKKMWYLLQLHARACKESECTVPRCRDLKEHLRRSQQQSESRRRAAVMEMMRQRAAEVACTTE
ncbi:putative histone acetyltransferase HAC-like 1 [Ananas comosus]|uniref:histone acetyltransferase n=1 Tax=Ananas comosus TaxID=4615 RepID=A0A199UEA8_ANACO|nr:putative histone acetyltransferase HAC-like 1 [Ananas comosus]